MLGSIDTAQIATGRATATIPRTDSTVLRAQCSSVI